LRYQNNKIYHKLSKPTSVLFVLFCASFFPSCSFWDLAATGFAKEVSAFDSSILQLLLNEHDTAAQPKERNDTAEMKLMIQKNQIMIETVLLRMEQLRIQLAVPVLVFS
jgi:hypothetical protein